MAETIIITVNALVGDGQVWVNGIMVGTGPINTVLYTIPVGKKATVKTTNNATPSSAANPGLIFSTAANPGTYVIPEGFKIAVNGSVYASGYLEDA